MNSWGKAGIVTLGYVLAFGAGGVASHLYNVQMAAKPYDTSGGMYAAGEAMTGLSVFLVAALVPTLLALWFLRGNTMMWQGIAVASLAFAGVGLIAVLRPLVVQGPLESPTVMVLELVRLTQLLGVPLWTGAFILFALLAPARPARRLLRTAIGLELVIGVCAALHWFVPGSRI